MFLANVDRFPWRSQLEFFVVRATHKVKSLGFVPHFSLSSLCLAFLAWGDFHVRLHFARSTVPEEKWGLIVV